jgi:hypothetical protein
MNEDPEMAQAYQDTYGEIKYEKEFDYNESLRLADRFEY